MRKPANDNISYFGGCPTCGGNDGCVTDSARKHWYYCRTHRTKWCIGRNLFSVHDLSQRDLLANSYRLRHYEIVEPIVGVDPLNGPRGSAGRPSGCADAEGHSDGIGW